MSVWDSLPKSSGLGKLSKKHKRAFAKSQAKRKANKPIIKARTQALSEAKKKRVAERKAVSAQWHFWGSRASAESARKVASDLKRQGYKVKIVHEGTRYNIQTLGKASKYS